MSGFVSFLKKAGQMIVNAVGIVEGLGPIFTVALPAFASGIGGTAISDLEKVKQIILNVESVGVVTGLSGPQKFAAAVPQVSNVLQVALSLAGSKDPIANGTLFNQAAAEITQGMVDLLNSLKADPLKVQGTGATAPVVTSAPTVLAPVAPTPVPVPVSLGAVTAPAIPAE